MLARSVPCILTLAALTLATATGAEARRLRLFFGSAKTATPAVSQPVGGARAVAPSSLAAAPAPSSLAAVPAPANRSGSFVFVGGGRGAPAGTVPAEEPVRPRDEPRPVLATTPMLATTPAAPAPSLPPVPDKPARPAYGFETVSAQTSSFEVVKLRN